MTDRLLNRKCRVTLAVGNPVYGAWFQTLQDTIVIEGLDVKFKTERHLGKKPNEAEIVIYNLSAEHRAACKVIPLNVTLETSYDDAPYSVLFKGDIRNAESVHDRVTWLTTLQIGDGERAFSNATISQTFKGGLSGKDALAAAAKSMGLSVPKNADEATALIKNITSGGFTLEGASHEVMSHVLDSSGLGWSIQDEQLQILGENDVIDGNGVVTNHGTIPAIKISQALGMIGIPDYRVPKALGKPAILKVKTLVDSRAKVGHLIQMDSVSIQGNFRLENVKNQGDTHGRDWYTEMEAKAL